MINFPSHAYLLMMWEWSLEIFHVRCYLSYFILCYQIREWCCRKFLRVWCNSLSFAHYNCWELSKSPIFLFNLQTDDHPSKTPVQQIPPRPTSLHTSSSLPSLTNQSNQQVMSPSGRGPPPKPPPRAYSPISNDSNMKRYSFSRMAPLSASTATPSNIHPSPVNPSRTYFQHAPVGGLSGSSNSDSAFKRFSFTGINVTPSMISDQADSSNIHTPGQTAGQNHLTNGNQNNIAASLQNLNNSKDQVVMRRQKPQNAPSHYRSSYQGSSSSQVPATSESAFKRFSFTGVNVSPAMTSDFKSGGQDFSGTVHEQHNPIYQSTEDALNHQRSDVVDHPTKTSSKETNQRSSPETSEDFIHKYTILQPDDIEDSSQGNHRILSTHDNASGKPTEKERLLEFSATPSRHGPPDPTQMVVGGRWRPVDPKNPNSYMETEIWVITLKYVNNVTRLLATYHCLISGICRVISMSK